MIVIGNVKDISPLYDKNLMIVRSADSVPEYAEQITELSPSPKLFKLYREAYHKGNFNEDWFRKFYVPMFIKELKSNISALAKLDELCKASRDSKIFLCCYCEDDCLCHRSIIGGILLGMNAEIEVNSDYIKYYKLFLKSE